MLPRLSAVSGFSASLRYRSKVVMRSESFLNDPVHNASAVTCVVSLLLSDVNST